MVSNCANPLCGKPLVYLRDGQIYIFDVSSGPPDVKGRRQRRLEHYWLCGACSKTMTLVNDTQGVRVVLRPVAHQQRGQGKVSSALAS